MTESARRDELPRDLDLIVTAVQGLAAELAAARGEPLRSSPAYNNWSPDVRDWSPQRQRDWLRWQP